MAFYMVLLRIIDITHIPLTLFGRLLFHEESKICILSDLICVIFHCCNSCLCAQSIIKWVILSFEGNRIGCLALSLKSAFSSRPLHLSILYNMLSRITPSFPCKLFLHYRFTEFSEVVSLHMQYPQIFSFV